MSKVIKYTKCIIIFGQCITVFGLFFSILFEIEFHNYSYDDKRTTFESRLNSLDISQDIRKLFSNINIHTLEKPQTDSALLLKTLFLTLEKTRKNEIERFLLSQTTSALFITILGIVITYFFRAIHKKLIVKSESDRA